MNFLKQTLAVTLLNLRTIPQRLGSSGVAIVGIAGVVIVLVSVLSIAQGFSAAMEQSGSDNRALVMRSGADSEMTSGLGGEDVLVADARPRLFGEWRTQEVRYALQRATGGATKTRILFETGLSQCSSRRLTKGQASAAN